MAAKARDASMVPAGRGERCSARRSQALAAAAAAAALIHFFRADPSSSHAGPTEDSGQTERTEGVGTVPGGRGHWERGEGLAAARGGGAESKVRRAPAQASSAAPTGAAPAPPALPSARRGSQSVPPVAHPSQELNATWAPGPHLAAPTRVFSHTQEDKCQSLDGGRGLILRLPMPPLEAEGMWGRETPGNLLCGAWWADKPRNTKREGRRERLAPLSHH